MNKIYYRIIYISLILASFLFSGCYVTSYSPDPIYEDHPVEVYYNGIDI